mmetsp:Transcript_44426/g.128408  ORF Transcript_44426/g.128408 Transcript_44426/m.128408 type:complete len:124 (+) Transcript_44426:229-600(+)
MGRSPSCMVATTSAVRSQARRPMPPRSRRPAGWGSRRTTPTISPDGSKAGGVAPARASGSARSIAKLEAEAAAAPEAFDADGIPFPVHLERNGAAAQVRQYLRDVAGGSLAAARLPRTSPMEF